MPSEVPQSPTGDQWITPRLFCFAAAFFARSSQARILRVSSGASLARVTTDDPRLSAAPSPW